MPDSTPHGNASRRGCRTTPITNKRRILVLGASGFIGRRVVEKLARSDWASPVATSHRNTVDFPYPVEALRFDARNLPALEDALRGVTGVVNCVTGDSESIIASAQALFAGCSRLTTQPRIVHLSTMMVYGTATGIVDETVALRGDWDDYSAAKAQVEQMARNCNSVVHLRPGIVYGPRSPIWSGRIGQWLRQRRLGDLGSSGNGYCNLVHIDDVVDAVYRALQMTGIEGQAFNLSAPPAPTWNDYFRQFAGALGAELAPISRSRLVLEQHVMAPPLKLAVILSQMLRMSWHPPEPIRPWLLRLCGHSLRMDSGKAERVLGIRWTPIDQGLREAAAWLLSLNSVESA